MAARPRTPRDDSDLPLESDRVESCDPPRVTSELFGHHAAERILLDAFRANRLPQAWLIGGRRGIGKATLAWRFARFLAAHPDPGTPQVAAAHDLAVPSDDPAARRVAALAQPGLTVLRRTINEKTKKLRTEIGVDDARATIGTFHRSAAGGEWRIAIVDEASELNRNSANALLKMIEEPPARALFLIVAHRPASVLPTIRSRCRLLMLEPLKAADVERAVRNARPDIEPETVRAVAARARGSVQDALRLLHKGGLDIVDRMDALLARLPDTDMRGVHTLADMLSRDRDGGMETALALVFDWLDDQVFAGSAQGSRYLAPLAEVWDKIAAAARETEALNLDRRPLILSMFTDLAQAVRATRADQRRI